jgi:SAM-dependent methyltransferase
MAIQGEIDYLKNLVADEREHAVNKPFSDPRCGEYLVEIGTILRLLPPAPARLLDLGCGTGWTSCLYAKSGYEVVGQDVAADMIVQANRNKHVNDLDNVHFIIGNYEDLAFEDEFDAAVFFDSLHHSLSEERALEAVYRALRPGGICITCEPGVGHARSAESVRAMRRFNVTERDMPPRRIIRAARQAGFCVFQTYPQARHIHTWVYGGPTGNRWAQLARRVPGVGALVLSLGLAIYKRYNGLVVMMK